MVPHQANNANAAWGPGEIQLGELESRPQKTGFDIDSAVSTLDQNAYPRYSKDLCGLCARAVRTSLEAGGIETTGYPYHAKDYGQHLSDWGFKQVSPNGYTPIPGDIRVIQPYTGGNPSGHINMYNGSNWVSDFVENGFWPGPGYRAHRPPYKIFRWPNK